VSPVHPENFKFLMEFFFAGNWNVNEFVKNESMISTLVNDAPHAILRPFIQNFKYLSLKKPK